MIRALRRRHRLAWSLLALLAPAALVAALVLRAGRPSELQASVPRVLLMSDEAAEAADELTAGLRAAPLWDGWPLHARVVRAADGGRTLELLPSEPLLEPDLLVYVAPSGSAPPATALPAEARLLGALSGTLPRRWALPVDARDILLYSLAHAELVARAALPGSHVEPATPDPLATPALHAPEAAR